MNAFRRCCAAVVLLAVSTAVSAAGPQPLWTVSGFAQPESVVYAADKNVLYVSNINGEGTAKDGNGFIAKVSPDGKMIKRDWLRGLNAPKGLGYRGGLLYIADIDELLVVDTGNGRIKSRHKAAGAKFLNDVALDSGGRVYVSDMFTNTIWRLNGDSLGVMLASPKLEGPNGLLVEGDKLIVGSWGVLTGNGFETSSDGYLQSVNRTTNALEPRLRRSRSPTSMVWSPMARAATSSATGRTAMSTRYRPLAKPRCGCCWNRARPTSRSARPSACWCR